uniref:FAD-binding domain-containing protein n=1 Tax=Bionectria ochroleuca TaxID=29856 RepID=A0A8H7NLR1_BIOOC
MLPNGMRALYQLGLGDALDAVSSPLSGIECIDHQGKPVSDLQWFFHLKEKFGAFPRVLSRHDLTRVLYEGIPTHARSHIYTNKKVSNITVEEDRTIVSCADGTSYSGSIVIGADGAHSSVRQQMRILGLNAGSPEINEEQPFLTTYRCLWLRIPTSLCQDLKPGATVETHGPGAATQFFVGEETAVIGLYETLDAPTRGLDLKKAHEGRVQSGLVSLEEGVVEHWSWGGRIVLVGDAAHKFTPSTGAGCNNGILDIVSLANEIHKAVESAGGAEPSKALLDSAFKAYQDSRYATVTAGCGRSGQATAMATWQTRTLAFVDRHVLSVHALQKFLASRGSPETANMQVFDYINAEERMIGKVPWVNPMPAVAKV